MRQLPPRFDCTAGPTPCEFQCGWITVDLSPFKAGTYYTATDVDDHLYYFDGCGPISEVACEGSTVTTGSAVIQTYGDPPPQPPDFPQDSCASVGKFSTSSCYYYGTSPAPYTFACDYSDGDGGRTVSMKYTCGPTFELPRVTQSDPTASPPHYEVTFTGQFTTFGKGWGPWACYHDQRGGGSEWLQHDSPPISHMPYDWDTPTVGWFGGNATHFENTTQLEHISRYSMAIFGWQHLIFATNWTASVYAQLNQAAILKAQAPKLPVFVYAGFGNADGYNAATWEIIKSASDGCPKHQPCRKVAEPYTDWVLETDTVPVYSMSACEQMGLGYNNTPTDKCWNPIWNVANSSVIDYFVSKVIAPVVSSPPGVIDGVFFDCFNFAYQLPSPWNRKAVNIPNCTAGKGGSGCEALLTGTIELARRIALALNEGGKVPIFSNPATFVNPKGPGAPFWLNESRLLDGLKGTNYLLNYEFVRCETIQSSGQLANMLEEGKRGVRVGVHVYLKNATEDVTPHLAAFMVVRREGWYFFASTGWLDDDWAWHGKYDAMSKCGKPLGPPIGPQQGKAGLQVYTRQYQGCSARLACSKEKDGCSATLAMGRRDM